MATPASPAPNLVIIAAPAGVLAGVRDALQDWSALRLVQPFCWTEDPAADGGRIVAQQVEGGRAVSTTVEQLLAERDYRRIRLCVLVPAFGDAATLPTRAEDRLLRLVRGSRGAADVDYLRVTVTRPHCGPGTGVVAREGWHNIVLSPEDSRGPGLGHQRLEGTDDPLEIGSFAAPGVCSLTGLWLGVEDAPMDDRNLLPAQHARVARSFFRSLDADVVEQTLRDGVMSMTGELPKPRVGHGRTVTVEDVPLATSTMADQLWTKNAAVLRGPRTSRTSTPPKPISVRRALAMLFGYLGAAIRNAPMAWYKALTDRVASSAAASVQHAVLGRAPSAYEVVVRGIRADGSRASWSDLSAASSQLGEAVSEPTERSRHLAHTGLATLWQDYAAAALTLADAGERSAQLPPVSVGVERAVLPRPADCVPDADSDFDAIPSALAGLIGQDRIEAADVLAQRSLGEALAEARSDPMLGLEAERTISALADWASKHEHSFAVQSGRRLGSAVLGLTAEVRTLLAALATGGQEQAASDDLRRRQKRLAIWVRVLALLAVVVLVVLGVLGGLSVLAWSTVAIAAGGALVVWFVGSFVLFLRGQRNLFAELHRREVAASEAEVNRDNLRYALEDLRRTTSAYGQHLAWSRALGSVLARPFGTTAPPSADASLSREGLPMSMALANATPEPAVMSNVCAQVRRDSFRAGWLTTPWEQILADAPARLGSDGIDLRDDPTRMYAVRAGRGSLLDRWVELLRTDGPGRSSGEAFWATVAAAGSSLTDQLVEQVSLAPGLPPTDRRAFLSGVGAQDAGGRGRIFDGYLFTASARTRQADSVAESWSRTVRRGLGLSAVTVELSEGLPTYDLEGLEAGPDPRPVAPPDTGMDF